MELRRYFNLIRRRLALVIVAAIVGGVVGFVTTSRTPIYTATATIYVGNLDLGQEQVGLALEAGLNEVVATFAQMIPSPVIAQKAIAKTHTDRFAGEVAASTSAVVVTGTNLIDVSVKDADPADAVRLANGVSNAFVSQISKYQSPGAAGTTGTTSTTGASTSLGAVPNEPAYVFQEASSASKSSSGVQKKVLLGAIFGLVIAAMLVLLLDYLDVSIKGPEELERRVGLPVLGIVPRFGTLQLGNSRVGTFGRGHGGESSG
jgi:capsular polysaccharide biosynthesis protein